MLSAQNELKIFRQGGNWCRFAELKINADGTYAMGTAVNCFGDPAGTWHVLGIHLKTKLARDGNGFWGYEFNIAETDDEHVNLLNAAAPLTLGATTIPELKAESGTRLKGGGSVDATRPVFATIYSFVDDETGKNRAFYSVGQFDRDTSIDFDPENWSSMSYKWKAIDAKGFVFVNPVGDARFTGITAPTLSGNNATGVLVTATA